MISVENRKIFPPTVYVASQLTGFSLELGIATQSQKIRITGLQGRERSLMISSAVWIQYTNVTDRRTDGRTRATAKTAPTHSIAR